MRFSPPIPIFRMFDEAKALAFYTEYLGFEVDWRHRFEPDAPLYMQVSLGECILHLSEHHGDSTPGSAIRIETEVRPLFEHLKQRPDYGNNPAPVEQSWGMLELAVIDPFGNRLIFCEELPA